MHSIELDHCRRAVIVDGQTIVMAEKVWQVLKLLVTNSDRTVSRSQIIDEVWQGNYLTGDKGLNQAIWTLRSVLGDDKQAPHYIRTYPRKGYQWVAEILPDSAETNADSFGYKTPLVIAATLTVFALALLGIPLFDKGAETTVEDRVATKAWLVDRDIHVALASGCRGVVVNANYADISAPVLSADGRSLAVTVQEDQQCRMLTIDVATGEAQHFADCPPARS